MIEKIKANNLNNFFINNGKNLTHATHLVIDLSAINDTPDEIISALNKLKKIYMDMRIIVLADGEKNSMDFLRRMYDKGVYDIVRKVDDAELELCIIKGKTAEQAKEFFVERPSLTSEEKQKEHEQKRLQEEQAQVLTEKQQEIKPIDTKEIILPNKDYRKYKPYISVAVCGTEKHIGATHNALLITKFLTDIGFKACYLEANEEQKIFYLKSFYPQNSNFNQRKCLLQCFGLDMYSGFQISSIMANNYDVYVFDLGVLTAEKLTSFMTKDIRVLVSGAKAWELNELSTAIQLIGTKNKVSFLLNLCVKKEESKLLAYMDALRPQTFFSDYIENPFAGGVNLDAYKMIFSEYILQEEKAVATKKKKGLFHFR